MSNQTPPPGDGAGQGDQPSYGQQPYGQTPSEPSYGQTPSEPSYGQPEYGQQPYGQPQSGYDAPAAPTVMPSSVNTAVMLMWGSVALSVLSSLVTFMMLDTIVDKALEDAGVAVTDSDTIRAGAIMGGILGLIIGVAIYVVLIMFIKRGANWARIVITVLGGLGLLFALPGLLAGSQPAILMLLSLLGLVLTAATLWFLWQKDSNAWFAKRS